MIYIVSSKNAAAIRRALGEKSPWANVLTELPKGIKFQADDQIYLDISGLSPAVLKKTIGPLKRKTALWGIIDPKGAAGDPASFFYEGACDYIGSALVKKGLSKKRFSAAASWAAGRKSLGGASGKGAGKAGNTDKADNKPAEKKTPLKLPAGKFEGWQSIRAGTTGSFFFLFAALSAKTNLRSMVNEAAFNIIKNRLRDTLQQGLREANALLWMESESSSLFLVPPRISNCRAAIEAALKMILNSRLIGMEKLNLAIPVEFVFALHYGKTVFQAPGSTGTVISDTVNYIFHLGTKKAETGRLTVSDDVGEEMIPEGLLDLFNPAGVFEGIPIRHSRRFIYK